MKDDVRRLIRKARPAFRQSGLAFPSIYTVEGQPTPALRQADSAWETVPWKDQRRWNALDEDSEEELREETVRLHAHTFFLLPDDEDRALIRSLWPHGRVHINYIRVNDFTSLQRLAAYVTKESRLGTRPVGERSYVPSLGLIQPETDGRWCDADEGLSLPHAAEELKRGGNHDASTNSHMDFLTYRFPRENTAAPKPYKSKGRISTRQKNAKTK